MLPRQAVVRVVAPALVVGPALALQLLVLRSAAPLAGLSPTSEFSERLPQGKDVDSVAIFAQGTVVFQTTVSWFFRCCLCYAFLFFFLHGFAGGWGFTGSLYVVRNRGLSVIGFYVQWRPLGYTPTQTVWRHYCTAGYGRRFLGCLEDLSVLTKMRNWFQPAICWAVVFQCVRYQVLFFQCSAIACTAFGCPIGPAFSAWRSSPSISNWSYRVTSYVHLILRARYLTSSSVSFVILDLLSSNFWAKWSKSHSKSFASP